MKADLKEMAAQIDDLDEFSQRSIWGAWGFFANKQCINQGIYALPDVPEEDGVEAGGIEGYTQWEAAVRQAKIEVEDAGQGQDGDYVTALPAWIALQQHVHFTLLEMGGRTNELKDTWQFISNRLPTRRQFETDFAVRVRLGNRPGITRKDFVDAEFKKAMASHEKWIAKGEPAITLIDRLILNTGTNVERGFDDLPEWVFDSMQDKLIQKMRQRWDTLEITRTSGYTSQSRKDESVGNQMILEETLAKYGETIVRPEPVEGDDLIDGEVSEEELATAAEDKAIRQLKADRNAAAADS
jgi:hypothetical protein